MNKKGEILSSFKKEANSLEIKENEIILGKNDLIEFYKISEEYKFTLEKRVKVHSDVVYFIKCIDKFVFTASDDRTLGMFYKGKSVIVSNQRTRVINVFIIEEEPMVIAVLCEGGTIYFQEVKCFINGSFEEGTVYATNKKICLDGKICSAEQKNKKIFINLSEKEKNKILLLEDKKIKKEFEITESFSEMQIKNEEIFLKNENGIKVFDLKDYQLKDKVDFPEVLTMAEEGNKLILGCEDGLIRVYDDLFLESKLQNKNSLGKFFDLHKIKNVIFSVTGSGFVSVFDLNNLVCFRSFQIECRVSSSALNEDGTLLFLSDFDTNEILVIDVLRGKKVDSINNGTPVLKMTMNKSFLFVLTVDSLIKYDLFNSTNTSISFLGNSLAFGDSLAVCADKTVNFFDKNLYLVKVIDCLLKGRNISEKFNKAKPITKISFDHLGNILLGGCTNQILMINEKESKKYKVSFDKGLENYKEKLGKEEERKFEEKNLIEVIDLIHSLNSATFFVLSKQSLLIYKAKESKILFDSLETEESAESFYAKKEFHSALFLGLKMNLNELVKKIIRKTFFDTKFTEKMNEKLAEVVVGMIEERDSMDSALLWLKNLLKEVELKNDDRNKVRRILEEIRKKGWLIYKREVNKLI